MYKIPPGGGGGGSIASSRPNSDWAHKTTHKNLNRYAVDKMLYDGVQVVPVESIICIGRYLCNSTCYNSIMHLCKRATMGRYEISIMHDIRKVLNFASTK